MVDLLRAFKFNPPAYGDVLVKPEARFGSAIPRDYIEFMRRSYRGEAPVGEAGFVTRRWVSAGSHARTVAWAPKCRSVQAGEELHTRSVGNRAARAVADQLR
jgi:O-acetyl-ADP-ribose deacetylase (regulator of RNase III)